MGRMDDESRRVAKRRATVALVMAGVLLVADVAVLAATRDHREDLQDRVGWDTDAHDTPDDDGPPYGRAKGKRGHDERGESKGLGAEQRPGRKGRGDQDESEDSDDRPRSGASGSTDRSDPSTSTTSTTVPGGA
jgi:hypothetical protein